VIRRARQRGKRKWIRVLLFIAGGLVVVVVGLLIVLRLTAPPPIGDSSGESARDLPESWLTTTEDRDNSAADSSAQAPPSAQTMQTASATAELAPPVLPTESRTRSLSGRLIFYGGERPFGEEAYEIESDGDGALLTSTGEFRFRALVATLRVVFDQRLEADADFVPLLYESSFDAPLGFDREVRSEFADGIARTTASGNQTETPIRSDRVAVLGTFSTYALLPILFAERAVDDRASFDVLVLGGPPGSEDEESDSLPSLSMERLSPIDIRASEKTLSVDAYLVRSDLGLSLLLAKDEEFLAFLAGDEDGTMSVFRSDFFPDGFEILSDDVPVLGSSYMSIP